MVLFVNILDQQIRTVGKTDQNLIKKQHVVLHKEENIFSKQKLKSKLTPSELRIPVLLTWSMIQNLISPSPNTQTCNYEPAITQICNYHLKSSFSCSDTK